MSRDGAAKITHAMKDLRMRYDLVQEHWNDGVRRDFEKNQLKPMEEAANNAHRGMMDLAEVLARMRRECGRDDS